LRLQKRYDNKFFFTPHFVADFGSGINIPDPQHWLRGWLEETQGFRGNLDFFAKDTESVSIKRNHKYQPLSVQKENDMS
jgi:hypothetical protein